MRIFQVIISILVILLFFSCRSDKVRILQDEFEYFCDAELINDSGEAFLDSLHHSIKFSNGKNRSDECSFKGNFSIKLTPDRPYGFTIYMPQSAPDEYFKATVWRKGGGGKGLIVASAGDFYKNSDKVIETRDDGWEKLELDFFVPLDIKDELKLYVWNNGSDTIFFDDFNILRKPEKDYPEFNMENAFKMFYDEKAKQKIQSVRYRAFEEGVLVVGDDDYVNSIVFSDNDYFEAKIRLKGDWLDHIQGDKLSFRIKPKSNHAWRGMTVFSIQTPEARNFQHEWVLHQMLLDDDLLTTRFGFIPVYINGNKTKSRC